MNCERGSVRRKHAVDNNCRTLLDLVQHPCMWARGKIVNSSDKPKTIIFFDGGCRLCSAEIQHYNKLDGGRRLDLVDFTRDPASLNALGVSYEQAMRRLHALDQDGILRDGVRAFVAIWAELPYYNLLAKAVLATRSISWLEKLYARFADWRYARRCETQVCAAPNQPHPILNNTAD